MERLGLHLKPSLLPPPTTSDRASAALAIALNHSLCDIVSRGSFPSDLGGAPSKTSSSSSVASRTFPGPFFLEICDALDISLPASQRGGGGIGGGGAAAGDLPSGGGSKRCLKLSLTDGVKVVAGLEFAPLPELRPPYPGTKLVVRDVEVKEGTLFLTPTTVRVLGGA